MTRLSACIDRSGYAGSECDHAAWLAGRTNAKVEIVHVNTLTESRTSNLIPSALEHLINQGVDDVTGVTLSGTFPEAINDHQTDFIVMGKRGVSGEDNRLQLGRSIDPLIRNTTLPIFLTSKVFLPINRAVALLDADVCHRSALDLIVREPGLSELDFDVVVFAGRDDDPEPKLQLARQVLGPHRIGVFAMNADGPDQAVAQYIEQNRSGPVHHLPRCAYTRSKGTAR